MSKIKNEIGNVRRTYKMYRFFQSSRKKGSQPLRVIKIWELYKAVRTR